MTAPLPLTDVGRQRRLSRLTGSHDDRLFIVPLDHSVSTGPIAAAGALESMLRLLADGGIDGVILHKGRVRFVEPSVWRRVGLIVHLNGSTMHAPDTDDKVLVGEVEDALRIGADGVSVHVNLGSRSEARQLADLGAVAGACMRWSLPLVAMVYPRGPRVSEPTDPQLVAHAANLAADLGADVVKVPYTGDVETMADVAALCPIPIIAAGGAPVNDEEELFTVVRDVMSAGASGVAIGRNVFGAQDVARTVRRIADIVHPRGGAAGYLRARDERDVVGVS